MFEVRDWANNLLFNGKTFNTFEDGWDYLAENLDGKDELDAFSDVFIVEVKP